MPGFHTTCLLWFCATLYVFGSGLKSDIFLGHAILRSKDPLLPFEWYSLDVERRLRDAKMIIDGKDIIKGKAPGSTRGLNIRMDVYFGGFDGEIVSFYYRKFQIGKIDVSFISGSYPM